MQLYFRPTTTKMLGNLKIFTIAVLMRAVMRREFSVVQYEALFLLVAGERCVVCAVWCVACCVVCCVLWFVCCV